MTWEPRPGPGVTAESEAYWAAASEGRLVLRECTDCGLVFHPPRTYCPDCFGTTDQVEASGKGTVYSCSVTSAVSDWPDEDLPLVVAYVELDEGPRILTNIRGCDPEAVHIGMDVEATFVETDEPDIAIPVFEPTD
jgi:uncharacterized OB-fold protein